MHPMEKNPRVRNLQILAILPKFTREIKVLLNNNKYTRQSTGLITKWL